MHMTISTPFIQLCPSINCPPPQAQNREGDDDDADGGDGDGDGGTIYGCKKYAWMSNLDYDVNDNAYFIGVSSQG